MESRAQAPKNLVLENSIGRVMLMYANVSDSIGLVVMTYANVNKDVNYLKKLLHFLTGLHAWK